jgi:hypothetical protein
MAKLKTYYTLLQREDGKWAPQFGDYDRETVESERDDYRDHDIKAKDLKIVTTQGHSWASIQVVVAKLNGG